MINTTNTSAVKIADRWAGQGSRCFIAAEIWIKQNGELDIAKHPTDAAVGTESLH